ncbi:MAG: ChbG/HpnK family deacetylase [Candidatus Kariarchaeaceae archaeon]
MTLIINADDLGFSERGDNTIIMLHKLGVVSSTTILANGNNFSRAVNIARDNPRLGIGVHLTLDGPYNIGKGYSTIMDRNTNQFFNNLQIIKKLKRFSVDTSEIYKEYCLQIEKVLDHQIQISHIDHHHHHHLYLPVLNSMIKAAKKFNIHYIRPQKLFLHKHKDWFNYIYRNAHQLYLKNRLNTIDGMFVPAIFENSYYEDYNKRFLELLKIKNRIIEIMLHPVDMNIPETIFYSSKPVLELLSNQIIINYNDLK